MDVIFSQDFGILGIALVAFIVGFCVVMPIGVFVAMKKMQAVSQEQDARLARQHEKRA